MKTIEVDEELYRYIASQTENIGESASDILRRLLMKSQISSNEITSAPTSAPKSYNSVSKNTLSKDNNHSGFTSASKEMQIEPMYSVQSMLNSDEFTEESRAIGRFMMLLSHLYKIDSRAFSDASELKGRKRIYVATNKEILLANGEASKPKQIPNTPYWVITNTNTKRKHRIVLQLMAKMGFHSHFIERVVSTI